MTGLKRYAFLFISLSLLLSSCHTIGHLDLAEEQLLVRKNKINFTSKSKIDDNYDFYYQVESLIKPQPNGSYFFFAEERIINWDKKWQTGFKKRGSPPSIYTEELAEQSERSIEDYLFDRGYFHAVARHTVKPKWHNRKKAVISYDIDFKDRFYIDSINYSMRDTNDVLAQRLLNDLQKESLLKKGAPLDIVLFEQEKTRINKVFRNAGYANFGRNFIQSPRVDSTRKIVYIEVVPPGEDQFHKAFKIGDIYIDDNLERFSTSQNTHDTLINGIHFRTKSGIPTVRHQIILKNIFLKKGDLYEAEQLSQTLQQLRSLRVFRFVNRRLEVNPDNPDLMDFHFELTPGKSMTIGYDLEMNTSSLRLNNVGQRSTLVGSAASTNFQKRNVGKRAQTLSLGVEAGVELNLVRDSAQRFLNTIYISGQASYQFPKFLDYAGLWRMFHKIKNGKSAFKEKKGLYYNLQQKAKSRITSSVSWQNQIDFLQITTVNLAYGFNYQPNANQRFSVNHIGLDYLFPSRIPELSELFQRSLGKQLFTGFLLKSANVIYRFPSVKNNFFEIRGGAEFSGLEVLLANKLYNEIGNKEVTFRIENQDIDFSKFVRLEIEARYRKQISRKQAVAFRFGTGFVSSLDTLSVPFVRQFYSGGPNSLRAWRIRELGPGGFNYVQDPNGTAAFFQTGNFKLELNAEYRFPIYGYFDGAIFVDAGNIWTFKADAERPGAQLSSNFLNEIAIGTGAGLRFNYSLFLLRFDLGIKLRNNYFNETTQSYWDIPNWKDQRWIDPLNLNIGIDYPF